VSEEPCLRGPVEGVIPELQPIVHDLLFSKEELERIFAKLADEHVWQTPQGIASIGYHVRHCSGSTMRMLTYARGQSLSDQQFEEYKQESVADPAIRKDDLFRIANAAIDAALAFVKQVEPAALDETRLVGRKKLPSNVRGLLHEIATHTSRHVGQIATTARIVTNG
jgi:hypothetical protein